MSKQIDERVVEMRFDNRQFEANVKQTMNSVKQLDNSLRFEGAEKGFKNIDSASRKVDMTHLQKGVETVQAKFSALQVVGVTALANITNSALNAGKRLAKSLSIDQVTAGMTKYEQKTASVQTIMNATGKSIDEVNKYLEKLMWFSDETSYGFTDMTAALGQMTSSGGDIEKLIPLITGVANATAYAGKGASEFSRVMYNLNQSYGAGYLQLMDWKSLELAGVGSKQLKQTLIDVGVELGKIKKGQVDIGSFAETLKDKWADTEVMEVAFGRFGEFSNAVHKAVESGEYDTAADAIAALSDKYDELGVKAFTSAQEAKSFTEAIDATKDAVSSGWMQTFEIIFGNYEQAKVLWTDLCGGLWDIFASGGETRNSWLKEALHNNPWDLMLEKVQKVSDTIQAPVKKLQEYEKIVDRIIRGDFGNGAVRIEKLTEAGYDWAHAQNLVNEKLGSSVRHATNYTEELKEQTKQTVELSDAKLEEAGLTKEEIKMYRELEAESKKTGKSISELVNEMEKADGRTLLLGGFYNIGSGLLGIINALKEAFADIFPPMTAIQLYNLIKGFNEFTDKLRLTDKETGKLNKNGEKLKRTFKGLFAAVDVVLTIIGGPIKIAFKAFRGLLEYLDMDILDFTANVGDAIVEFRDWIDATLDFEQVFESLSKMFGPAIAKVKEWYNAIKNSEVVQKALVDMQNRLNGGFNIDPLIKVFTGLWEIIKAIGEGLYDVFKAIYDLPVIQNGLGKIAEVFTSIFTGIKEGVGEFDLNTLLENINKFFDTIANWISETDFKENGKDVIAGLGGGISSGISKVVEAITEICKAIYNTFTEFFDINSPSVVFFTLGKFCMAGLVAGLLFAKNDTTAAMTEIGGSLLEALKVAADDIVKVLEGIDLQTIFAVGGAFGMYKTVNNMINMMTEFGKGVGGFGKMCNSASSFIDTLKTNMFGGATKKGFAGFSENALKLAGAIAILAGSIFLLAKLDDHKKLWSAVGAIAALGVIITGLAILVGKFGGGEDVNFKKVSIALIGISAALWVMATAIKQLDFLNESNAGPILTAVTVMLLGLMALMGVLKLVSKNIDSWGLAKSAVGILIISGVLYSIMNVMKTAAGMKPDEFKQGTIAIGAFIAMISALALAVRLGGKHMDSAGMTIAKIAGSVLLLVIVAKFLAKMSVEDMSKGALGIAMFGSIVAGLIAATRLAGGKDLTRVSTVLFAAAGSIAILILVSKMLKDMSVGEMAKAALGVAMFGVVITGLIWATKLATSKSLKGVATTLLAMSVAVGMMAAIAIVLGLMDVENLKKGITAVSILGVIVSLMVWAAKDSANAAPAITAMATAIGVMAASVFVLSLIGKNNMQGLMAATAAMGIVVGLFSLAIYAAGKAEKTLGPLLTMSIVVGLLAGVLWALTKFSGDTGKLVETATSLGVVITAMSVALLACTKVTSVPRDGILGLTAMVVPLVAFAIALQLIPKVPDGLEKTILTISATMLAMTPLLLAMSGVTALSNKMGGDMTKGILYLTAMVIPLGVFAGALHLISKLTISDNINKNIMSLTLAMTAMAAMLIVISGVSWVVAAIGSNMFMGLVGMIAMAGLLYLFGAAVKTIPEMTDQHIKSIGAITAVMTVMSILCLVTAGVGAIYAATGGIAMAGILGLAAMLLLFDLFGDALSDLKEFSDRQIKTIETITKTMYEMSALLAILGVLSPFVILGEATILALIPVIGAFGTFAVSVGFLMDKVKGLKKFLTTGIDTLVQVAEGIGKVLGAFAKGFAGEIMSLIPDFGKALSDFMDNAESFIDGSKKANDEFLTGVKNIASAVALLTAADFVTNIGLFTGSSFVKLGLQLSAFMLAAKPFFDNAGSIKPESMTAFKTLADAIGVITASNVVDGLTSFPWQDSPLEALGKELKAFGPSLNDFVTALTKDVSKDQIDSAIGVVKEIATLYDICPKLGGLAAAFTGEKSLKNLGSDLESLGNSIVTYSSTVSAEGAINTEAITKSINAAKLICGLYDIIPTLGGMAGMLKGEASLKNLGNELYWLGNGLAAYSSAVGGSSLSEGDMNYLGAVQGSAIDIDAITTSVEAAKSIIGLYDLMPTLGGMVSWFKGQKDLGKFGDQLIVFGSGLASYATAVSGEGGKGLNIESINTSVEAAKSLAEVAKALPPDSGFWSLFTGNDHMSLSSFASEIFYFGQGMANYANSLKDVNFFNAGAAIAYAQKILAFIKSLDGLTSDGVETFKDAIGKLGNAAVDKFIAAFTNSTSSLNTAGSKMISDVANGIKSNQDTLTSSMTTAVKAAGSAASAQEIVDQFNASGAKLIVGLMNGMSSKEESAIGKIEAIVDSMVDTLESQDTYDDFYNAGSYCVSGFAKGIEDNDSKAIRAAADMAAAALQAAKDAMDSDSPSKEFIKLGRDTDLGMAIGISKYAKVAREASCELGFQVLDGMKETLDINSPAKVVKDDVGRWVVKGLAEGITSDMSAEEAAAQKADNIVSAFQAEFDKLDIQDEKTDLSYSLWEKTIGKDASETEKAAKNLESLLTKQARQQERVNLAHDEWQFTLKTFGENADETAKAYNKYLQAQINQADLVEQITEAQKIPAELLKQIQNDKEEIADLEYELWEKSPEGKVASALEKTNKQLAIAYKRQSNRTEEMLDAKKTWEDALAKYGESAPETVAAYKAYLNAQLVLSDITDEILDIQKMPSEDSATRRAIMDETAELEFELWEKTHKNATEAEKAAKRIELLTGNYSRQMVNVAKAENEYNKALDGSIEKQELYNAYLQERNKLADISNELLEEQNDEVARREEAIYNNRKAQIEYNKWLKKNKDDLTKQGMTLKEIEELGKAFTGYDPELWTKEAATSIGATVGGAVSEGIKKETPTIVNTVSSIGDACAASVNSESDQQKWKDCGSYMVQGFINGITGSTTTVVNATVAMVNSAITAAKTEIDTSAETLLSEAVKNVLAKINSDVDTTITIRPVIDLDEVQNGINSMNGMLGGGRTMALAGMNARSFNDKINARLTIIESDNDKIVSAITDLKSDFGDLVEAINDLDIRLDDGTLVGRLAGKIDSALGQIVVHKGRGN